MILFSSQNSELHTTGLLYRIYSESLDCASASLYHFINDKGWRHSTICLTFENAKHKNGYSWLSLSSLPKFNKTVCLFIISMIYFEPIDIFVFFLRSLRFHSRCWCSCSWNTRMYLLVMSKFSNKWNVSLRSLLKIKKKIIISL